MLDGINGAPGRIRTCDLRLRRPTLYPLSYGRLICCSLAIYGKGAVIANCRCRKTRIVCVARSAFCLALNRIGTRRQGRIGHGDPGGNITVNLRRTEVAQQQMKALRIVCYPTVAVFRQALNQAVD